MDYKWYIVNAVAGCENSVCTEINKIILNNDLIKEAFIPTKKAFKVVKGKKVETEIKLFPAYVFVNMVGNISTFSLIRGLPKVLGFLGEKFVPEVIPEKEIKKIKERMQNDSAMDEESFDIGDSVRIIMGPFETFIGTVESKDDEKKVLKISVSIFGRNTVIDIDYSKVEKL